MATSVLLFILILQSFSGAGLFINYYVNYSFYVKNCENKDKPAMHCNGQCQAMKAWKRAENSKNHPAEKPQQRNETLSSRSFFAMALVPPPQMKPLFPSEPTSPGTRDISIPVFHPPCA